MAYLFLVLITISRYFDKPAQRVYDIAFCDFEMRLNHLMSSPIGCIQDRVELTHFVDNILKFQKSTSARITIVSKCQKSHHGVLKTGYSHEDFIKEMESLISPVASSGSCSDSHLEDVDPSSLQMDASV